MLTRSFARAAQPRLGIVPTTQLVRNPQLSLRRAHNRAPRKPFPASSSAPSSKVPKSPNIGLNTKQQQPFNRNDPQSNRPNAQKSFSPGAAAPNPRQPQPDSISTGQSQTNTHKDPQNAGFRPLNTNPSEEKVAGKGTGSLPDLRQGIPSTFEAEFLKQQARAGEESLQDNANLDVAEESQRAQSGGSGGRGGGELPKSAYETSTDRRRNRQMVYSLAALALFGSSGYIYLGRNWETEEETNAHPDAPNGWSVVSMWKRANARFGGQMGYYTEPTFPKLLPTIDTGRSHTLVLSLEDLLVHSEWTREHGWRTAKRPGLDYFLRYLSQYYEIVIFTTLPMTSAELIIRKIDPLGAAISWPLFREGTKYEKGEYIKDLSYLNRDLSKVILIDTKAVHAKYQPENAIILPKWTGARGDKGLIELIPFLEHVGALNLPDVRKALKSFEGKDIPTEFAKREAKLREQLNQNMGDKSKKSSRSGGGFLMGALGMKNTGQMVYEDGTVAEGYAQGKTLSDQIRERGVKHYEMVEKEIKEHGESWLKLQEEEMKKQQEEMMKSMKSGFTSWIPGRGSEKPADKET